MPDMNKRVYEPQWTRQTFAPLFRSLSLSSPDFLSLSRVLDPPATTTWICIKSKAGSPWISYEVIRHIANCFIEATAEQAESSPNKITSSLAKNKKKIKNRTNSRAKEKTACRKNKAGIGKWQRKWKATNPRR